MPESAVAGDFDPDPSGPLYSIRESTLRAVLESAWNGDSVNQIMVLLESFADRDAVDG